MSRASLAQPPTLVTALDKAAQLADDAAQLAAEHGDAEHARLAVDTISLAEFIHELSQVLLRFAGVETEPER